jgi:iron complex outermembrane receptor protein
MQPLRCLFILGILALAADAQTTTVSGVIKDSQGAAIADALINLTVRDNTTTITTLSDSSGAYRFEQVPPGSYLITASAAGFQTASAQSLPVEKSGAKLDIELNVAAVQTSMVVTASGTAQSTDELAKAVTVIDSQSIDLRDQSTLNDVLRYVPGLRVQQEGGPGGPSSIKTRGLRNQDTAVLIDGFRLRDASSTQGDASGLLQDLIVTNLDRIEVMRGSGSSIYGTNATGGVINLLSGEGGGPTRGSVLLEGGSLGMFRGRAGVSGSAAGKRFNYSAGVAHLNVTSGIDGTHPDRTSSAQGLFDIGLAPSTRIFGRIFATDSLARDVESPLSIGTVPDVGVVNAIPLSTAELHRYENGIPVSDLNVGKATFIPDADNPDNTRAARIVSGALRLSSHPSDALGFSASYQGLITRSRFGDGPAGAGFQPAGTSLFYYDGDIHTVNARVDWRAGRHQWIDAGYEFEYEGYGSHAQLPDPTANYVVDVNQHSHAVFVQDQIHLLSDRLQIAGSYRAQFYTLSRPLLQPIPSAPYASGNFDAPPTAQTGDGSVAYLLRSTSTKIRAHVGKGYRAPSLYERFGTFYGSFGYSAYGDPRLAPERLIATDAGIDQSLWNSRIRLSGTYFYTQIQQAIIFDFSGAITPATDPFGRYGGYRNTPGGLARGVELSGSASPGHGFSVTAAYTYTNARERTPLTGGVIESYVIPAHQFSLLATQRVTPRLNVTFNLLAYTSYLSPLFNSETFASGVYRFGGVGNAELGGSYRIPLRERQALRFFAKVSNLADQTYFENGYRMPGITGTGGIHVEF